MIGKNKDGKIIAVCAEIDMDVLCFYQSHIRHNLLPFKKFTCENIVFKEKVKFDKCEFNGKVSFKNCTFEKQVIFSNSLFKNNVYFDNSNFKDYTDFHESNFMNITSFYGVKFQKVPNFSACYFKEQKAVNLVNVDISSLDFKKVEKFIDENYEDRAYEKDKNDKNNVNKQSEIEQKHKLRYAQNAKDSFRVIKDVLIEQNNILEAQEWHKLELYAKEKEIGINLEKNHKSSISKELNIAQSSEVNSLTLVVDNILLWLYRNTSLHHTNFTRILNFSICNIVLYSFPLLLLTLNWDISTLLFEKLEKINNFWFWATLALYICYNIYIACVMKKANTTFKTILTMLLFLFLAVILVGSMLDVPSYAHILFFIELYIVAFVMIMIHIYFQYIITNNNISYFFHCVAYISLLAIVVIKPQLINPFIGIFSNDKLFESKFEQKLNDLNSSTIINLAKISQKDFILQDDYNVSFTELNSAKMMILSNKNNIIALKDENLTKATKILGNALYDEISQAIQQDEILSNTIKSTSIIYSIILLLCIFSLQKTARKNSIIPS